MGAHQELLEKCFWKEEAFKEFGLFVCRFFKDGQVMFVIIDDRIPCKVKDGKVIFAGCKDPNEIWVPLIEKAYAKLHGCYKALIGGYTHYGLADMTGFSPRLIVMKTGFPGYCVKYEEEEMWELLVKYKKWNCLMGTSIQPNPKEAHKVEAEVGYGLHSGHAYSLLDVNEIALDPPLDGKKTIKLIKLRNPWGRGEWEGIFGDRSDEREAYDETITKVFEQKHTAEEIAVNFNDGTFFMPFNEWFSRFTSVFIAVNFPDTWVGKRTQGVWNKDVGGNRDMGTWFSNPKIQFKIKGPAGKKVPVFVGLYIRDSRLTMGFDYFKDPLYATPLGFDIVTKEVFEAMEAADKRKNISHGYKNEKGEVLPQPCNTYTLDYTHHINTNSSSIHVWKHTN